MMETSLNQQYSASIDIGVPIGAGRRMGYWEYSIDEYDNKCIWLGSKELIE